MKIALIGATGRGGSCILEEPVSRRHQVTAIAHKVAPLGVRAGVAARQGDVADGPGLTALLRGHNAAISAVQFLPNDMLGLIASVKDAGVPRFLVMGGAASLETADGSRLIDS